MTKNKLKVGDKFIYTQKMNERKRESDNNGSAEGGAGVATLDEGYYRLKSDGIKIDSYCFNFEVIDLELNNLTKTNMNLMQKFKLALRAEPEKTFIKKGIMTEGGELTQEGRDLYLNWLFQENMDDFNDEVVTLIDEEEKEI